MHQASSFISNFKFFIRIMIFIIIIIPIYICIGKEYEASTEHNQISTQLKQRFDDFYALDEDTLDILFIGSSHSYCTFDPDIFDTALGTSSFQMGTSAQQPDTTYFLLQEILKTQKPELIVLDIYWDVLDKEFNMKQSDFFLSVVRDEELKKEYIREVFPLNEEIKFSSNAVRYQADYFTYKGDDMANKLKKDLDLLEDGESGERQGAYFYKGKGYTYTTFVIEESKYTEENLYYGFNVDEWELHEKQKHYLELIVELAKLNDIELMFVTSPVPQVSLDYIGDYERLHEKVSKGIEHLGIDYIDYNMVYLNGDLDLIDEDFQDDEHLNSLGADRVCRMYTEHLKESSSYVKGLMD